MSVTKRSRVGDLKVTEERNDQECTLQETIGRPMINADQMFVCNGKDDLTQKAGVHLVLWRSDMSVALALPLNTREQVEALASGLLKCAAEAWGAN